MAGDYLLQTDWQARHKRGGLGSDRIARRALLSHVSTYTLAFLPAFIWIASDLDPMWAIVTAVLISLPHLMIDDGRFVGAYLSRVKGVSTLNLSLAASVDQSFHVLCLWGAAMIVGLA